MSGSSKHIEAGLNGTPKSISELLVSAKVKNATLNNYFEKSFEQFKQAAQAYQNIHLHESLAKHKKSIDSNEGLYTKIQTRLRHFINQYQLELNYHHKQAAVRRLVNQESALAPKLADFFNAAIYVDQPPAPAEVVDGNIPDDLTEYDEALTTHLMNFYVQHIWHPYIFSLNFDYRLDAKKLQLARARYFFMFRDSLAELLSQSEENAKAMELFNSLPSWPELKKDPSLKEVFANVLTQLGKMNALSKNHVKAFILYLDIVTEAKTYDQLEQKIKAFQTGDVKKIGNLSLLDRLQKEAYLKLKLTQSELNEVYEVYGDDFAEQLDYQKLLHYLPVSAYMQAIKEKAQNSDPEALAESKKLLAQKEAELLKLRTLQTASASQDKNQMTHARTLRSLEADIVKLKRQISETELLPAEQEKEFAKTSFSMADTQKKLFSLTAAVESILTDDEIAAEDKRDALLLEIKLRIYSISKEEANILCEMLFTLWDKKNYLDKTLQQANDALNESQAISVLIERFKSLQQAEPANPLYRQINFQLATLDQWQDEEVKQYGKLFVNVEKVEVDEPIDYRRVITDFRSLDMKLLYILQNQCLHALKRFSFDSEASFLRRVKDEDIDYIYIHLIKDLLLATSWMAGAQILQAFLVSYTAKKPMSNNSFDTFLTQVLFNQGVPKGLFTLKSYEIAQASVKAQENLPEKPFQNVAELKIHLRDHFGGHEIKGEISTRIRNTKEEKGRLNDPKDREALRNQIYSNLDLITESVVKFKGMVADVLDVTDVRRHLDSASAFSQKLEGKTPPPSPVQNAAGASSAAAAASPATNQKH